MAGGLERGRRREGRREEEVTGWGAPAPTPAQLASRRKPAMAMTKKTAKKVLKKAAKKTAAKKAGKAK